MPALIDENQSFQDTNGKPIVNGFVYVGLQDADTKANLINIFSDRELSVALANPQRTDSFGKSVNKIWVPGRHSLLVEDENNVQKLTDPDSGEEPSVGITSLTNVQIISNAITANAVPAITAYVDKQQFSLTLPSSLTGASTLDIDGVSVVTIKNQDFDTKTGQFLADKLMVVAFNEIGPIFEVINNSFNGVLHSPLDTNSFPINTSRSTVASAATTSDIFADTNGNEIDFTGTATVTDFPDAPRAGASRVLHCAGAVVFTNNSNLFVMGSANFTAAAGDVVLVHAISISTFRLTILKANGQAIVAPPLLHMEEELAAQTDGGTFLAGANRNRDLNVLRVNEISGASFNTGSSLITLSIGTYRVEGSAPAFGVLEHVVKFNSVSGTSTALIGTRELAPSGIQTRSFVYGTISPLVESTYRLQHQCQTSQNTNGFGVGSGSNISTANIFSECKIWRIR